MKKKLLSIVAAVALVFGATTANAQAFDEGKSIVTVGYGFPNLVKSLWSTYASEPGYKVSGIGPLFLKYEYGLTEKMGIGLVIGYSSATVSYTRQSTVSNYNSSTGTYTYQDVTYTDKLTYSSPTVGIRWNYHFATKDKIDPYVGVGAGWSGTTFKWSSDEPGYTTAGTLSAPPVYFAFTVGMRYYFTDNVGIYLELGWDKYSIMQGGLALKF